MLYCRRSRRTSTPRITSSRRWRGGRPKTPPTPPPGSTRWRAGLAGGLSGLSDEMLKRYESLTIRAQRQTRRSTNCARPWRSCSRRQRRCGAQLERGGQRPRFRPRRRRQPTAAASAATPARRPGSAADAGRRSAATVINTPASRMPVPRRRGRHPRAACATTSALFAGASDVLDVGCGRGEFLELLRDAGIPARGIDLNHEMVARCRAKGLDVVDGGRLVATWPALADEPRRAHRHPGGRTPAARLPAARCWSGGRRKLRPGAPIVLETINPACWSAFFESYIRDLTHVRPVHPDTLQLPAHRQRLRRRRDPVALALSRRGQAGAARRHPSGRRAIGRPPEIDELAVAADRNTDRLNALLFGPRDYAAIARRPPVAVPRA